MRIDFFGYLRVIGPPTGVKFRLHFLGTTYIITIALKSRQALIF